MSRALFFIVVISKCLEFLSRTDLWFTGWNICLLWQKKLSLWNRQDKYKLSLKTLYKLEYQVLQTTIRLVKIHALFSHAEIPDVHKIIDLYKVVSQL